MNRNEPSLTHLICRFIKLFFADQDEPGDLRVHPEVGQLRHPCPIRLCEVDGHRVRARVATHRLFEDGNPDVFLRLHILVVQPDLEENWFR